MRAFNGLPALARLAEPANKAVLTEGSLRISERCGSGRWLDVAPRERVRDTSAVAQMDFQLQRQPLKSEVQIRASAVLPTVSLSPYPQALGGDCLISAVAAAE